MDRLVAAAVLYNVLVSVAAWAMAMPMVVRSLARRTPAAGGRGSALVVPYLLRTKHYFQHTDQFYTGIPYYSDC